MPNRVIKDTICTSPNFNRLSDLADRHFYRCLLQSDDFGCFEATPQILKGKAYPLKDNVTYIQVLEWNKELEDQGLVKYWNCDGRVYGQFITFNEHNDILQKHKPLTPCPPWAIGDEGFDLRLPTETLQAYNRIGVAVKKLGQGASYRQIIKEAKCSMTTLAKYNKHVQKTKCYTLLPNATDVTPMNQNPNQNPNPNQKEDKELPLLSATSNESTINIYKLYERVIGLITPNIADDLKIAEQEYQPEWIGYSFKESEEYNKRNWKYIHSILENCKQLGHIPYPKDKTNGKNNTIQKPVSRYTKPTSQVLKEELEAFNK